MPRSPDFSEFPPHPAIKGEPFLARYQGRSRVMGVLECPRCGETRQRPANEIRSEASRPRFRGFCRPCALASVKDGSHRWENTRQDKPSYKNHPSGYRLVSPDEVPDDLLPMYRQMQRCGQPLLEHRWNMAKHLGRALTSCEMVDHMNGVKTDNRPENLRIYVRGKQQPGSCPGHGTYYHEWQMALAKIQELEGYLGRPAV